MSIQQVQPLHPCSPLTREERRRQREEHKEIEEKRQLLRELDQVEDMNPQQVQQQLDQFQQIIQQMQQAQDEHKREVDELKNQQQNQNMVTSQEMKVAEQQNYFAPIFNPILYPNGPNMAAAQNHEIRQWDDFLKEYKPKLEEAVDAGNWFGVFENSCTIHDIPLEKRYKKLISTIMAAPLRAKLLKKSTFFQANDNYRIRYEKLRKWLCTDSKMIRSVLDAEKDIFKWYKTEKTLLLNCEKFLEKVDHFMYTIRFAITHGVNQAIFDILSEQKLFKLFVQKVGQDRIRQEAEKYCQIRNLAVLGIICKQVDTEITIPAEYKLRAAPKEVNCINTGGDKVLETNIYNDEPENEEEVNYIYNRRGGYANYGNYRGISRDSSGRFARPNNNYGGNYRGKRRYNFNNRNNNQYRRRRNGGRGGYKPQHQFIKDYKYKSKVCSYCVKYGHLESDCYARLEHKNIKR